MRILGYIEHPVMKITVFKTDDRLSIKFENEAYEQTFKLGANDLVHNLETAQQLVDSEFVDRVGLQMQQMHQNRLGGFQRNFSRPQEDNFEKII